MAEQAEWAKQWLSDALEVVVPQTESIEFDFPEDRVPGAAILRAVHAALGPRSPDFLHNIKTEAEERANATKPVSGGPVITDLADLELEPTTKPDPEWHASWQVSHAFHHLETAVNAALKVDQDLGDALQGKSFEQLDLQVGYESTVIDDRLCLVDAVPVASLDEATAWSVLAEIWERQTALASKYDYDEAITAREDEVWRLILSRFGASADASIEDRLVRTLATTSTDTAKAAILKGLSDRLWRVWQDESVTAETRGAAGETMFWTVSSWADRAFYQSHAIRAAADAERISRLPESLALHSVGSQVLVHIQAVEDLRVPTSPSDEPRLEETLGKITARQAESWPYRDAAGAVLAWEARYGEPPKTRPGIESGSPGLVGQLQWSHLGQSVGNFQSLRLSGPNQSGPLDF